MEFQLKNLMREIECVEADIAYLRGLRENPLYKNLLPDFSNLIKKLLGKKRRLKLQFNRIYSDFLE
jgi:hypothetical protein